MILSWEILTRFWFAKHHERWAMFQIIVEMNVHLLSCLCVTMPLPSDIAYTVKRIPKRTYCDRFRNHFLSITMGA